MTKFAKLKQIPSVPASSSPEMKNFLSPVKQVLETYQGNTGDRDVDRVVRFGDLTKSFLDGILGTTTTTTTTTSGGDADSKSEALQIAIVGDSLSQANVLRDTWAWQLERLSDQMGLPITIKNWAVCGDTFQAAHTDHTEHQSGTRTQVEQAIAHGADIVFIALGINDAIFVGGQTSQEIIEDANAVYDELHSGLPDAKLVYVEEAPHDIDTIGLSPAAMTNNQCIPWSHALVTYIDKVNCCRVNTVAYENTASAKLADHQTWGDATTVIRTIFDDFFTINIWKMTKMGARIDIVGHPDTFGHMICAHTVLRWLRDTNDVDNSVLNIDLWTNATDKYLIDPDELYTQVMARDIKAALVGKYSGINIFARADGWFYEQAQFNPSIGPPKLDNARFPLTVRMEGCEANRPLWFSWDGCNFINANKNTSPCGDFHHTWIGPELSTATTYNWTAGTRNLAYAVQLVSGTYDVYVVPIVLTQVWHKSHVRYRRDAAQVIARATLTPVLFNVKEWDTLTEYTPANGRFTAKEPGYYHISGGVCSAQVAWGATDFWCVWVCKNGSYFACGDVTIADAALTSNKSSYVNTTVEMDTGDYIDIRVYHNRGGNVNVVAAGAPDLKRNHISIDRMTL